MPARQKKAAVAPRTRAPAGKKQVLVIMDAELIRQIKIAAAEDERKMSHVVEEAVREWLDRRKNKGEKGE